MKRILFFFLFAITAGVLFTLNIAAETIITNEFWICNSTNTANRGTVDNPYDGSTRAKFDALMNAMPPNSTIHILAGKYETWGSYGWYPKSGDKIVGSGIDHTILQFPSGTPQGGAGNAMIYSQFYLTNTEISDLTCDCNWTGGSYTYSGVVLTGTHLAVRRVKVENEGYTSGTNSEAWGISLSNFTYPVSEGNVIEECEIGPLAGGHNITAICFSGCSGIIRDNRVFLTPDPVGAQIAYGVSGDAACVFEGNYVDGADGGCISDTGSTTNVIFAHNIFKNVYNGFVFWNAPRQSLTFDFNKIFLTPSGSYYSTAFGFPDGTCHTNIVIIGNDVEFDGTPSRSAYFLSITNVVGLTVANNTVDSRLENFVSASGLNMFNNYDLNGNYLPALNIPTLGGVDVSPSGLSLISNEAASAALVNSGLPGDPGAVLTNNATGVNLSGTFSGSFSGNGGGLTGLNWSDITGAPDFVEYSDPAPTFANGMNISSKTAYQIGGVEVLWCSNSTDGSDLIVGYESPGVVPNGIGNLLVGSYAMPNSTNANRNTMVGVSAGRDLLSGADNTIVGEDAGLVLKYGDHNTFVGSQSGYGSGHFTNGYENTLIGDTSLYRARIGNNNLALGYMAGSWLFAGTNNVFIAHQGTSSETNSNGAIYIGDPGVHNSAYIAGTVYAGSGFAGNGNGLTNIPAANITGTVTPANLPFYVRTGSTTFPSAGSAVTVMFSSPVPNTNYIVTFGFESAAGITTNIWYNSKTTNGFVAHGTFSPNNVTFDYIAMQRQ